MRRWDASAIDQVFRVVKNRDGTYKDFGDTLGSVQQQLSDWGGEAGDAFHQEMNHKRQGIDAQGRISPGIVAAVEQAEADANACRSELADIDQEAAKHRWYVPDKAWMVDYVANPNDPDGVLPNLEQRLDALHAKATAADHELATAMRAAVGDVQLDSHGHEVPPTPLPATPPGSGDYHPMTAQQLQQIVPELTPQKAQDIVGPLNDAMREGGMNTPLRQAAFISQVAVESDRFNTYEEYADGTQYDGRTDLGNTQPGDGPKYKGRGAIQVTGRYNYEKMSKDLGVDFVDHPELAAEPQYAFKTALWYWGNHDGNAVADGGDIKAITEMVNGGDHALDVRTTYYNNALKVLGG